MGISKIIIEVGGKEIELSLDEAKELKKILDEMFACKEVKFVPSSPVIIERYNRPWYRPVEYKYETDTKTHQNE